MRFRLALLLCGFLLIPDVVIASERPVYVVPIHGEIDQSLMVFVRRSVERASANGASHIIFDIDTFGGRVDSALQITTVIGSLTDIETVAYVTVRPEGTGVSWSAGALISLACDAIYMAPGTSMGSAAPIIAGPDGSSAPADEKTVSAVRAQMAALAEKNGYPVDIARAMVDFDVELVEAIIDGEVSLISAGDRDLVTREAERDDKTIEFGRVVSPAGKLLNLTAGEMERYGVSSGTPASQTALEQLLGVSGQPVVSVEPTAADQAVSLLTGAGLTSLLILIGIVALFVEITSPGFGVPGAIGILCFAVIFTANGLLGQVGSVELLVFIVGIVLLVLEIFVIPGFGIAGISGILLVGTALVLSLQSFVLPSFAWEWRLFHRNVLIVVGNILAATIVLGMLAHFVPRLGLFSRLVLTGTQAATDGFTVQEPVDTDQRIGRRGTAVTVLRPAGKAQFDGEVVAVESDGDFIESGSSIEIIAINGNRTVVGRTE